MGGVGRLRCAWGWREREQAKRETTDMVGRKIKWWVFIRSYVREREREVWKTL